MPNYVCLRQLTFELDSITHDDRVKNVLQSYLFSDAFVVS